MLYLMKYMYTYRIYTYTLYVSSRLLLYEYDLTIYLELFTLSSVKCSYAFIISK